MKVDSLEEAFEAPEKLGLPSFEEFCRNPEKYLGHEEDVFAEVEQAGYALKPGLHKVKHEIAGFQVKTIYEIYKIARDRGIPFTELDYEPHVIPLGSSDCDLLVKWMPKSDARKREKYASAQRA